MNRESLVLEFRGHIASKKNMYTPRKDKPGMFKNSALVEQLGRLAVQIPSYARDLKLEHPSIDVYFYFERQNWDRTNAWQTIEDLLVEYGVLANDNIRRANGTIVIHPAEKARYDGCKIILTPQSAEVTSTRYLKPVKKRIPSVLRHIPEEAPCSDNGLEDFDGGGMWEDL